MKYITRDRKKRPFEVVVTPRGVTVYNRIDKTIVKQFTSPDTVVIPGVNRYNKKFPKARGHTVLIVPPRGKIMFVGWNVVGFNMTPGDTIECFYSTFYENGDALPMLLGTQNAYFIIDATYVPRSEFPRDVDDKYWASVYYKYINRNTKFHRVSKRIPGYKQLCGRIFHELYI